MFCTACGAKVEGGSKFCSSCGAPLVGPADHGNDPSCKPESGSLGGGHSKTILVVLIVALLAAIATCVIFAFLLPRDGARSPTHAPDAAAGFESIENPNHQGVEPKTHFDDYSWADIDAISSELAACSDKEAAVNVARRYNIMDSAGHVKSGLSKSFTLADGTVLTASVVGVMHDERADGTGKIGLTFLCDQAAFVHPMNGKGGNKGGWSASDLRSHLAGYTDSSLPGDLSRVIKTAKKYTNNTGATDSASSVTMTRDKLWCPSYQELAGDIAPGKADQYVTDIYDAEGEQYELFALTRIQDEAANGILVRNLVTTNQPVTWWVRSPRIKYDTGFRHVLGDGNPDRGEGDDAYMSLGVVFGFCV